jgi:hypothetical protein
MENGLTLSEVTINLYVTGLEYYGSNCPFPAWDQLQFMNAVQISLL